MELALAEARRSFALGEVPVGAVVLKGRTVLGKGRNLRETLGDPTAHAEMMAIRQAACAVGNWRLLDTTLYVTLEPCPMCAGAIVLARIPEVVVGARDAKSGAVGSIMDLLRGERLNHRVHVTFGVKEDECSALLERFFRTVRRGVGAVERARLESG